MSRRACLAALVIAFAAACPPPDPGQPDGGPPDAATPDGPPGPPCADGIDNDEDGWADAADPDCATGDAEAWVALAACSDGIDNDRDGAIDSGDTGCTEALDGSELDHPGNPACSNGVDDDGDGLIDVTVDPGCAGAADADEGDEGDPHNFAYTLAPDSQLVDLSWTDPAGTAHTVVHWNPATAGDFYLHGSSVHVGVDPDPDRNYGFQYSTDGGASYTQFGVGQLEFHVDAQDAGGFQITVTPDEPSPHFQAIDRIRFSGDTIYWSIEATNLHTAPIQLRVPAFFGLTMGDPTATSTNGVPTQLTLLQGTTNNVIWSNFNANGMGTGRYPINIGMVSPVAALWDNAITVGQQLLTDLPPGDVLGMRETAYTGGGIHPVLWNFVDELVPAGASRTFVLAYTLAPSAAWHDALAAYQRAFAYRNGSLEPSYCPSGPIAYSVGANSDHYDHAEKTYVPGTELTDVVPGDYAFMGERGITRVGVWATATHTRHLTDAASECQDGHGPGGGSDACEFSSAIDLLDPNLAAGPDPTKIDDFAAALGAGGVGAYWFARPCTDVIGAAIDYGANGEPQITTGEYQASIDLRRVADRDRYYARMKFFVDHGVKGFYVDASGCPGDEALFAYLRRKLPAVEFLMIEGFRDRASLWSPQIPFPKFGTSYDASFNAWIDFISPDATYYGGEVNTVLIGGEFDDFVSKGGQGMMASWQFQPAYWQSHPAEAAAVCARIAGSYANAQARWDRYGSTIPGCAAPPPAPACP